MTTPTHDLAIARAERDAWQSTCEELHRTIAGRDVEIEAHLGRCEAMKRDATVKASQRDTFEHESSRLRAELAAIRDLVAPGNPQGTVVDAVRARLDAVENAQAFGIRERDAAIARAEKAESDLSELTAARDRLLAREHEDGRLHAQLRAELAELRARPVLTEDLLRGALDAHGHAALTRKLFAHLGPFTLPSPDRAEELCRRYHDIALTRPARPSSLYSLHAGPRAIPMVDVLHKELTALANLSPAPAPALDAAFLRRVMVATKHGPNGKGGPGPCDAGCVKCEAERMAKAAPAREVAPTRVLVHADGGACHGSRVVDGRCVGCGIAPDMQSTSLWLDADARPVQCEPAKVVAPTLVAVSDEELAVAFYSEPERPALRECIDAADLAGIRAVRAKLGAAEVTEERVKAALCAAYHPHREDAP